MQFLLFWVQDESGLIIGAEVTDTLSGKNTQVFAKQVINATGPFTDSLRKMSDPSKPSIIMPSAGVLFTASSYCDFSCVLLCNLAACLEQCQNYVVGACSTLACICNSASLAEVFSNPTGQWILLDSQITPLGNVSLLTCTASISTAAPCLVTW